MTVMAALSLTISCSNATNSNTNQQRKHEIQRSSSLNIKPEQFYPINKEHLQIKNMESPSEGFVPVKLYIPAVRIDAIVEPVIVSDKGRMGVPMKTDRVGYLTSGVLPGAVGNAVMDGHVDNNKGPAVFFPLKKLKKGDTVVIQNDRKSNIKFIVESVESFKTAEAPRERIFGPAEESRLNLITCTGKYNRKKKEYESRLVVFTKRL